MEALGATFVATRHLHKGEKTQAIYAGGGSIAFTAVARSVILAHPDPDHADDESRGILAHTKINVARPAPR